MGGEIILENILRVAVMMMMMMVVGMMMAMVAMMVGITIDYFSGIVTSRDSNGFIQYVTASWTPYRIHTA